jgi:hypothetical protein
MAPAERQACGLAAVDRWLRDRAQPVDCYACGAPGLVIVDQSARPYREWYAVSCARCGERATLSRAIARFGNGEG